MSTLLNKSYIVKVSMKGGEGVKNTPNSVYMVCTQLQNRLLTSLIDDWIALIAYLAID